MADVGPGVFQQRADLNLGLQSQDFRRNGGRDAGGPELLRIDHNDVMHRAVAELGGTQSLADVLAVGPIDVERLLDELAHGPHLVRSLGDDPPAAEVRHADQRIRRTTRLSGACRVCVCGGSSPRNWGRFWHCASIKASGASRAHALLENRLQKLRVEQSNGGGLPRISALAAPPSPRPTRPPISRFLPLGRVIFLCSWSYPASKSSVFPGRAGI